MANRHNQRQSECSAPARKHVYGPNTHARVGKTARKRRASQTGRKSR